MATGLLTNAFESNVFESISLTDTINKTPIVPQVLSAMNLFAPRPVNSHKLSVEELNNVVGLLPETDPHGPATILNADTRTARLLTVPNFKSTITIKAAQLEGVRAIGTTSALEQMGTVVGQEMGRKKQNFYAPTWEYLTAKALQGYYVDPADAATWTPATGVGATIDFCTLFGVDRATDVNIDYAAATAALWFGYCLAIRNEVLDGLGGRPFSGIVALLSRANYATMRSSAGVNDIIQNVETGRGMGSPALQTLAATNSDQVLANAQSIYFGGITWVEVASGIGTPSDEKPLIEDSSCVAFPVGVPQGYIKAMAPPTQTDLVNTLGQEMYAKARQLPFDEGVEILFNSSCAYIPTAPASLVRLV